jgi:thioredoxin 1
VSKLRQITAAEFEHEVLRSPVPVAVDFFGEGCGPCRVLSAMLEPLAQAIGEKARIVTVNVVDEEALADKYEVAAIPTIIVFQDGREVRRMVGLSELGDLRSVLGA